MDQKPPCPYSRTKLDGILVPSWRGMPGKPSVLVQCPHCGGIYRTCPNRNGLHFPRHESDHATRQRACYRLVEGVWQWGEVQGRSEPTDTYRCVRCGKVFRDLDVFLGHDHGIAKAIQQRLQRETWAELNEAVQVLILFGEGKKPLVVKIQGFEDSLLASSPMYAALPGQRRGNWLRKEIQITREQVVALVNEEPDLF